MFVPYKLSKDNFEQHNAINYYSHALLTLKLLPKLAKAKTGNSRGRIVIVSSGSHHASWGLRLEDFNSNELYSIYHAYAQSKLALIMFTYTFDRMLRQATLADGSNLGDSVSINCLHPGICRTSLMNSFTFFKFKPIQESLLFRVSRLRWHCTNLAQTSLRFLCRVPRTAPKRYCTSRYRTKSRRSMENISKIFR